MKKRVVVLVITLIIFSFILITLLVIEKSITGKAIININSCLDSDKGRNYYESGKVVYSGLLRTKTYSDSCKRGSLYEYY